MEQLQSHIRRRTSCIWGNAQIFNHILYEEAVSHIRMILQLLQSEFPYIWMKIWFSLFNSVAHLLSLKNSVFWRRRFGNHHYVAAPFDVRGKIDGKRSCDLASWSWSITKWKINGVCLNVLSSEMDPAKIRLIR
jgi:hypothetical protein